MRARAFRRIDDVGDFVRIVGLILNLLALGAGILLGALADRASAIVTMRLSGAAILVAMLGGALSVDQFRAREMEILTHNGPADVLHVDTVHIVPAPGAPAIACITAAAIARRRRRPEH